MPTEWISEGGSEPKDEWKFLFEGFPLDSEMGQRIRELKQKMDSCIAGGMSKDPVKLLERFIKSYELRQEELLAKLLEVEEELTFHNDLLKMLKGTST